MPIQNYGAIMGDAAQTAMMPYNTLQQSREQASIEQRRNALTQNELHQTHQHDAEEAAWDRAYAAKDWGTMAHIDPHAAKLLYQEDQANKPAPPPDPITEQTLGSGRMLAMQGGKPIGSPYAPQVQAPPRAAASAPQPKQDLSALSPKGQQVLGELTVLGAQLPGGLRGKDLINQTINSLITTYPDQSPREIAQMVKEGKVNITADSSSARAAGNIAGRVAVGLNEIKQFSPMVIAASNALPRSNFVPLNKVQQMGQAAISDPRLKVLNGRVTALLNAYDVVAGRGGTDMDKRKHVREMIMSADSPEALTAAVENLNIEATLAEQAADKAMHTRKVDAQPAAKPPPIMSVRLSPADASKLPAGTRFVGMDGVERVKH